MYVVLNCVQIHKFILKIKHLFHKLKIWQNKNMRIYLSCMQPYFSISYIIKHPKLCRTRPTLFLAHCKAHKSPTQSQPCKELKMPTHSPPTPADEYLSTFVRHFSTISLLGTQAHPPPNTHLQHICFCFDIIARHLTFLKNHKFNIH